MLESAAESPPVPPDDATYPRLATATHPRRAGTYGPAVARWALDRPELHPLDRRRAFALRWWQEYALHRAFEHDDAGALIWRTVIVSAPRQVGKSWLERIALAWRIHAGDYFGRSQDVLHVAHKLQAAQEVWRPAARWALGVYGRKYVREANGEQKIEVPGDGSRWLIQAANAGAGVSFSLSMALVDEAWQVARNVVDAAIAPTLAEAEQPQLWLVSTAGTSASDLMLAYRALALAFEVPEPDDRLLLLEWSAPPLPDLDLDDPEVWRMASPFWSTRRREVVADARRTVPEREFCQQWLNQWVTVESTPLFEADTWAAAAWGGVLPAGDLVFGVDVASDRSHAVICTMAGGVVEIVDNRPGVLWLVPRLAELVERWKPRAIGVDGSGPAATVADQLRGSDAERLLVELTARQMATASAAAYDAINEGRLAAVPNGELTDAVLGAKRRAVGQSWAFARQVGDVSCAPLLALVVASWAAEHAPDLVERSRIW